MAFFRNAACLAAVSLLAACGGGGNGPAFVMVPPTLQGPNTTKTYDVSSATLDVGPISGRADTDITATQSGSTVTVTTDAAGRLTEFAFHIEDSGDALIFDETYTDISGTSSVTLDTLATAIRAVADGGPGANGFLLAGDGLSYSSFGGWASNEAADELLIGFFAGGNQTATADIPVAGSATCTGTTIGAGGTTSPSKFAFRGDVEDVADFAGETVTMTFSSLVTEDIDTGAISSLPDLHGTGSILSDAAGTLYEVDMDNVPENGYLAFAEGAFYGPNAEETAGSWRAESSTTSLAGSFGARR